MASTSALARAVPLTAAAAAACWAVFGPSPSCIIGIAFAGTLVAVSLIDLETSTIPPALVAAIAALAVLAAIAGVPEGVALVDRLLGLVAASAPMLVCSLAMDGMGGGDIKLMAAAGLLLGWKLVLLAFAIGAAIGALQGIFLIAFRDAGKRTAFPFGPALSAGCFLAYLAGSPCVGIA